MKCGMNERVMYGQDISRLFCDDFLFRGLLREQRGLKGGGDDNDDDRRNRVNLECHLSVRT